MLHHAVHGVVAGTRPGLEIFHKVFVDGGEDCGGHLRDLLLLRFCLSVVIRTGPSPAVLQAGEGLLSGGDEVCAVLAVSAALCLQRRRELLVVGGHHLTGGLLQAAHLPNVEVPAGPVLAPDHVDEEAGGEAGSQEEQEEREVVKVQETGDEAGNQLHHILVLEVVSVVAQLEAVHCPEHGEDQDQHGDQGTADQTDFRQSDSSGSVEESPAREGQQN